jgi:peptidoglycan/LPS O-acetylase OafA/YrhL
VAEPSTDVIARSVYLDALRAVALVRIVTYHVTDAWQLTAFTSLPLMFFIAGTLFAASVDRRPAPSVVHDRFRRILVPYWGYAVAIVVVWAIRGFIGDVTIAQWVGIVMPVLSVDGVSGPQHVPVDLTWFALWYIQMHLVLALIGGPLRRAQRRWPRGYWVVLALLFVLSAPTAPGLAIGLFYAACWSVGYLHHDGLVEAWVRPRWRWICLVCGPVGAVAFFAFHDRAIAVAALGGVLLGVFWLTLALGLQPRIEPWLEGRRPRAVTTWFSRRSLTIYLWHGAALWAVTKLALPGGLSVRFAATWAFVIVAVVAVGWLEDVAARRPPQLWPHRVAAGGARDQVVDLRGGSTGSPPRGQVVRVPPPQEPQ